MRKILNVSVLLFLLVLSACEKEVRNIAATSESNTEEPGEGLSTEVVAIDINEKGFDLLERMQGHWVGYNKVIADEFDWFSFDYRATGPSQVHGIFEGGSMGNLLTSFFVADFKGTKTIMARNGGLLNGIYRTSYFVLDSVSSASGSSYYRLVDAHGGSQAMYMDLNFTGDSLYWNAYTSRLGENDFPTRHMTFKGYINDFSLAESAANETSFPSTSITKDFSEGFNESYLYSESGSPKSASFLYQGTQSLEELGQLAGDPYRLEDYARVSKLKVNLSRTGASSDKVIFLYLSKDPLTDASGFMLENNFQSVLYFPELLASVDEFTFTYLHPGNYYVTAIADANGDGWPGAGDLAHPPMQVAVAPEGTTTVNTPSINVQN